MPEPTDISPVVKPAAPVDNQPVKVQADSQPKRRAFWRRRGVWIIAALLIVGVALFGYHWAFGKAKIHYTTAAVTRGDVESTVVAAGIVQPIKYGMSGRRLPAS
jgi:multidrug efflux pump subunit AcrA (membrane-fusion protein)